MLRNRTLLAISFVALASYMGLGMIIPVRVLYAEEQGASYAVISMMATAFLISNFIFQYPAGWAADRWGRKRIMVIGLAVQALLTALYLLVPDPLMFVALRFIEGIAAATILPSARAIIADSTPPGKQGQAYGIFGAFFNAGFVVGPGIGSLLAVLSYESAFIGSVLVRLVAIVVAVLLVHDILPTRDEAMQEQAGPVPLRALFALPLVGVYVLTFGSYLWTGFETTIFPLWMRDQLGGDVGAIGMSYIAFSIPTMLLSPIGGRLADRYRRSRLILVFGVAQAPLYFVYGLLDAAWPVVALFALHGALFALLQPAVDAHLAASSRADLRARVQGLYSSMGLMGAFVGANGLTAVYTVDFRLPMFIMGAVFLAGILAGGGLVRISEDRQLVPGPHERAGMTRAAPLTNS